MTGESLFDSLTTAHLRGLYDHLGTMPFAAGSWSNAWREVLSEALVINRDVLPNYGYVDSAEVSE